MILKMKYLVALLMLSALVLPTMGKTVPFGKGQLQVTTVARNAVRIQYTEGQAKNDLPDWLYVKHDEVASADIKVDVDNRRQVLTVKNNAGRIVFTAKRHTMTDGKATLAFDSPKDEFLFGLGQFQDGYSNVRGLSRRRPSSRPSSRSCARRQRNPRQSKPLSGR